MKGWLATVLIIAAILVGYYIGEKKPGMFKTIGL